MQTKRKPEKSQTQTTQTKGAREKKNALVLPRGMRFAFRTDRPNAPFCLHWRKDGKQLALGFESEATRAAEARKLIPLLTLLIIAGVKKIVPKLQGAIIPNLAILNAFPALASLVNNGLAECARQREADALVRKQQKDAATDEAINRPPIPRAYPVRWMASSACWRM